MKQFIKDNPKLFTVICIFLLFLGIGISYDLITYENRSMGAVVLEHNVTADNYGRRTYTTLIKTDDGIIIEKEGLNYYVIPIGNRITIEVRRPKKHLMKIKLQNYSLINNEWIQQSMDFYQSELNSGSELQYVSLAAKISLLEEIKEQLIPSEKLAEVCLEKGADIEAFSNQRYKDKQNFLKSEIEIL